MRVLLVIALVVLSVSLQAGPSATAQEPLVITLNAWHDANFDGVRQTGEEDVPQLFPLLDSMEPEAEEGGSYRFEGLQPGVHTLVISAFGSVVGLTHPELDLDGDYSVPIELTDASIEFDVGLVLAEDVMRFFGSAWLDGEPAQQLPIRFFVGDTDCSLAARPLLPTDTGPGAFVRYVAPDGLIEGCGGPGSEVSFTIDGLPADQTVEWAHQVGYTVLTAGKPVSLFSGGFSAPVRVDTMEAMVNGVSCGVLYGTFGGYFLAVLSDELKPGCGEEGDTIHLVVNGKEALRTLTWQAGYTELTLDESYFDESFDIPQPEATEIPTGGNGGIRPPDTGDGGLAAR